ncbi:F-box/kelch-repeat protein At3g06240-like [Bidens hawaiensis]|uniref:F-box/kelch-repeat protein At3g06240-like n=1 Tax=Bidens hawaiensis TaxID=980011 RepID=UPI004049C101
MIHQLGRFKTNTCTVYSQRQFPNIGIPIEFPFRRSHIVGSCNGILCVYDIGYDGIYLWNPSIERQVRIPRHEEGGNRFAHLYTSVTGFGFDPTSEDYKVLRAVNLMASVYTVKTRTWRDIAPPPTLYKFDDDKEKLPPCLFNGLLHWAVSGVPVAEALDVCRYYIMAFDLSSEVFSKIELPEPTWETNQ